MSVNLTIKAYRVNDAWMFEGTDFFYREDSGKADNDVDEPWIMTVKGPRSAKSPPGESHNGSCYTCTKVSVALFFNKIHSTIKCVIGLALFKESRVPS